MRNIKWTEAHAVHVPEVDGEHQMLFDLCERLQRALLADAPASLVQSLLAELLAHSLQHFSHEEHQMRAAGYSLYEWHRRQHRLARSKVLLLKGRVQNGDHEAALEALELFCGWLNNHIRLADRMLGAYLRNHQRMLMSKAS